jgi:hypothetical protein
MAQNKIFNYATGIINSATTQAICAFNCFTSQTPTWTGITITQPYAILKHIRLINTLATASVNATLFKGTATATSLTSQSFAFSSVSVPAQSYVDWYGQARFDGTDYLNFQASLATSTLIEIDGEIGLS